jgi:hypothetical protein
VSNLLQINVNEHTEKKNGLTYLSWAWAWAEVLKVDPKATWIAHEWNGLPAMFLPDDSAMVKVSVTILGDIKECPLPVMDHRNKAIKKPDAFAINTATMRALAKAISMHGLGLYIYAGEDLPEGEEPAAEQPRPSGTISATKEAAKATPITAEEAAYVIEVGEQIVEAFDAERELEALRLWRTISDNDLKIHLWNWLQDHSKLRSFLKANKSTELQAA